MALHREAKSAAALFDAVIRSVGGQVHLERAGQELPFAASIQPRQQAGGGALSPAGYGRDRRYTMYAGAGGNAAAIRPLDTVVAEGVRYRVDSVEEERYGGQTVYRRAFLRRAECREEDAL